MRWFRVAILPALLIAGIIAALYYFFPDVMPHKLLRHTPPPRVVARFKIPGLPPVDITDTDVLRQKAFMSGTDSPPASNKQALQIMVRNRVLYQEALGRGVAYTREEAAAMALAQERLYESGAIEGKAEIDRLISTLGVDAKTYWEKILPERYQLTISQFRLRQAVRSEMANLVPPGNEDKFSKLYDKWVESVMAKVEVQVLDQPFIEARDALRQAP